MFLRMEVGIPEGADDDGADGVPLRTPFMDPLRFKGFHGFFGV